MKIIKQLPTGSWRFYAVLGLLGVAAMVLVYRMAALQVIEGERGYQFLQRQGKVRSVRTEVIPAHRGMIMDRNGEPLAVSTPVTTLWGNPQELFEQQSRWAKLAQELAVPYGELKNKLTRYQSKEFVYLKRHMVPQQAEQILALDIPGVYATQEYQRFYPAGEVAAQLVGFTNIDDQGQEGIELSFNSLLHGEPGSKRVIKDLHGRIIKDVQDYREASPGKDLQLSIDLRVQYLAYRELKTAIKQFRAKAGSVVVMDTRTGELLAVANQPSFNPNNRRHIKAGATRNRAITDVFEPGSTMKPLSMVAALESGRYTPHTPIDTNPGYFRIGRKTLLDPVNYGVIDVTKVITKSSQVGMSKIALDLDEQALRDVFLRVGLGRITGSGFPGESSGVLPDYPNWKPIEKATLAFGYGLSVTALQLARAYSIIANKGISKPISLLKTGQLSGAERVIDSAVAANIINMLQTVTESGGTATQAQVPAYKVAGKTGTAHKSTQGGYADSHYLALFVGMAPVADPHLVAVIVVDDPQGNRYHGGEVAAPVFSKVMTGALRLLNIRPDNLDSVATDVAQKTGGKHASG